MILFFMISLMFLTIGAMLKKPIWEDFASKKKASKPPADITKLIDYVSCTALNRPVDQNDMSMSTIKNLDQAPFWSANITAKTLRDALNRVVSGLRPIGEQNKGKLRGPGYLLVGRNVDTRSVNVRVYLPSVSKDGKPVPDDMLYKYHSWLRAVLFAGLYAVPDWLCNNACEETLEPLKYDKKGLLMSGTPKGDEAPPVRQGLGARPRAGTSTQNASPLSPFPYVPVSQPECGCISAKSCPFANLPWKFSVKSRNKSMFNSYSVYKLSIPFFQRANITLEAPYNLLADKKLNGAEMYQGCDTRMLSNNRLHALEIDASGVGIYETNPGARFGESCIPKPEEKYVDKNKVLKERYDVTGTMPRLVINTDEIAIQAILTNPTKNTKEWVSQWKVEKGTDDPYSLVLEDNGNLLLVDKKGIKTNAEFVKAK